MARLLIDKGYKNVRPLLGGFDAWMEKGFPVEPHIVVEEGAGAVPEQVTLS